MAEARLLRATAPLDAARRSLFKLALRHPAVSDVVTRRDTRLAVLACAHAAVAFALAVLCPVLLLVLGPILLGVAHVVADVRYLVVRRALPRALQHGVWACSIALVLTRVLVEANASPFSLDRAEWVIAGAWCGVFALAGGVSARRFLRGGLAAFAAVGATAVALQDPAAARLVFAQAHNVVAIVLWLYLFRGSRRAMLLPVALVGLGAAALASGQLYSVTLAHGQVTAFGVHVLAASDWLAPGLRADHAIGLTSAFAFLQSVHYAVWLLYVPQDDSRFEATPSFRASLRGLLGDLGRAWVVLVALAVVVVIAFGFVSAVRTRHTYLSLALFHGYLELALLGYFFARGGVARARG